MNYHYDPQDPMPPRHRYRTRVAFPLKYLAALLRSMIDGEENACQVADWVVPPYATLKE